MILEHNDKAEFFNSVDSYDIENNYKKISRDYVWKYLVETEASIKTGKKEPAIAIEMMILRILQP